MKRSASTLVTAATEEYPGIESYGISVTTLEEVFLRVAGCDFDEPGCVAQEKTFPAPGASQADEYCVPKKFPCAKLSRRFYGFVMIMCRTVRRSCELFFAAVCCFINFISMRCCCTSVLSRSDFWQHSKALLKKRARSARRDQKTIVFQLVIPAVFLLFGLLLLKLKPHPDQQAVMFTTSNFNPLLYGGGGAPIPFDLSYSISKKVCRGVFISDFHIIYWFIWLVWENWRSLKCMHSCFTSSTSL